MLSSASLFSYALIFKAYIYVHPLPNNKILDQAKLKAFADKNVIIACKLKFRLKKMYEP